MTVKTQPTAAPSLLDVLEAIDKLTGDDFCCDLEMRRYSEDEPSQLSEMEKVAQDKLSTIYRLAHGFNTRNSCHHVHDDWRNEFSKCLETTRKSGCL